MSLCSHHVSVSDLQLKTGAIVKPTKILSLTTLQPRQRSESRRCGKPDVKKVGDGYWKYMNMPFITIYSLFGFFWSTFYTLFDLLIMYNVTMHFCFGRGYPILTQVQFPPASCGSRAQAVWPHRRLPDLCPVLVRWWGCTARAGDVFGFFGGAYGVIHDAWV